MFNLSFYHTQRSWGKVMFLQVCGILFTGGRPDQIYPPTGYTPTPSGTRYTPTDQVHTPPGPGRYGLRTGGTHPTGMHSFITTVFHSVHRGDLGLCLGGSLSQGLWLGGSLSRGSLSREGSVQRVSVQGGLCPGRSLSQRPPSPEVRYSTVTCGWQYVSYWNAFLFT